MNQGDFFFFGLSVHPSSGNQPLASQESEADSAHPEASREILEGLVQENSLGYRCQNIPPRAWKMNCRGGVQVEKKIPQARTKPWILAGCKHSLY